MKLLLFWAYYPKYLKDIYSQNPDLQNLSYQQQQDFIISDYFGWCPALCKRIEEQGNQVIILMVNAEILQKTWAKENGYSFRERDWQYDIPLEQVKRFCPDVIWIGSMFQYYGEYLTCLRSYCKKIFAWVACSYPKNLDLSAVDCVLTSHRNFYDDFISYGKKSELLFPAFESKILDKLGDTVQNIECSFIGSMSYDHLQRIEILKRVAESTPIQIWSSPPRLLSKGLFKPQFIQSYLTFNSLIKKINPNVWGVEMYRKLSQSKSTINVHVDTASGLAGNMRMFEATGVGTLLITENSSNIKDFLEPGREVAIYNNTEELIELIKYYGEHTTERQLIASAGQKRTLLNHNTYARSLEALDIFNSYLAK